MYFISSNYICSTLSSQIKALKCGHSSVVNELDDEGDDERGDKGGDESKLLDKYIVHWSGISDLEKNNYTSDGEFSLFKFDTNVSSCFVILYETVFYLLYLVFILTFVSLLYQYL